MRDTKIEVRISSRYPFFVSADCDTFGSIFAEMDSEEQVHTLRAMIEHMRPHRTQWDYISIELEKPENAELRDELRSVLFPSGA